MLQAAEAVTASFDPTRVRQSRTRSTRAVFELDPYAVEDALDGVIVPGFEGSIRATLTDIRPAPLLVMLGAPGVYPDGFKVTNAARTAPLSETEQARAHALVKTRLTEAGIAVTRSKQPADHQVRQIHNPASISSTNTASWLLDSTSLSSKTAMTIMHDTALDLEQEWIVPGFVPLGLTILAGAPKLGKSWLGLQASVAVARGDFCLGDDEPCTAGDVLYLALEDNDRRLHRRLKTVAKTTDGMDRLHIRSINDDFPRLDQGGLEFLNAWCDSVEAPRLIIIDTLARARPTTSTRGQSAYEADYAVIGSLQKVAAERELGILVITHTRKASASDPFDCVSGTLGISGAADATMVMRKKGDRGPVTLYTRGRDIEELEVPIQFDADECRWSVASGDTGHSDHTAPRSPERATIMEALMSSTAATPMTAGDVVTITGMPSANVRKLLSKMVVTGEVLKVARGKYVLPESNLSGTAIERSSGDVGLDHFVPLGSAYVPVL